MAVSVSVALLLAILLFAIHRNGRASIGASTTALLLGYCLADTTLGPTIGDVLTACIHAVQSIGS